MSTETDEDRAEVGAAPAVIWSSDEAAAAQDKLVAESSPLDVDEAGLVYGSGSAAVVAGADSPDGPDAPVQSAVAGRPQLSTEALLSGEAEADFLRDWAQIQMSFVEDPRQAVQSADTLVQEIGASLRQAFEDRRSDLAAGPTPSSCAWRCGSTAPSSASSSPNRAAACGDDPRWGVSGGVGWPCHPGPRRQRQSIRTNIGSPYVDPGLFMCVDWSGLELSKSAGAR